MPQKQNQQRAGLCRKREHRHLGWGVSLGSGRSSTRNPTCQGWSRAVTLGPSSLIAHVVARGAGLWDRGEWLYPAPRPPTGTVTDPTSLESCLCGCVYRGPPCSRPHSTWGPQQGSSSAARGLRPPTPGLSDSPSLPAHGRRQSPPQAHHSQWPSSEAVSPGVWTGHAWP